MTPGPESDSDRSHRPGWLQLAPFLGRAPDLTRRQWRVLGLTAVVTLFGQYALSLFSLALKQIQGDLGIPEPQLGTIAGVVRLGALPAFVFGILADRVGRRRVLLITVLAYTLLTGATAFATGVTSFVVLQLLARAFCIGELLLAYVIITEELDAEHRGWGVGALAALSATGSGLALLALTSVEVIPGGWRALYLLGLAPLVALPWLRRSLPETERFEAHARGTGAEDVGMLGPARALVHAYPGRLLAVSLIVFVLHVAVEPSGFLAPKYFQEMHGWTPGQFGMMGLFGGFLGIFGSAFAGRLSDRHGRKLVAGFFLALNPLFVIGYYNASGLWLPPLWIGSVFTGIAGGVVLAALANEIFPTSHRSTASGARTIVETIGGGLGLAVESLLFWWIASHWSAVSMLALVGLLAPIVVWLAFPETSGRTLEEIAPERGGSQEVPP